MTKPRTQPVILADTVQIPLHDRRRNVKAWAVVDIEDFEKVCRSSWCLSTFGYAVARIGGKNVFMHKIILEGAELDHINRIKIDNRKSNLRACTHAENGRNLSLQKKSRFKGVFSSKRFWRAQIVYQRQSIHLGSFRSEIAAAEAYDKAAMKYHGEFAATNKMLGLLP